MYSEKDLEGIQSLAKPSFIFVSFLIIAYPTHGRLSSLLIYYD